MNIWKKFKKWYFEDVCGWAFVKGLEARAKYDKIAIKIKNKQSSSESQREYLSIYFNMFIDLFAMILNIILWFNAVSFAKGILKLVMLFFAFHTQIALFYMLNEKTDYLFNFNMVEKISKKYQNMQDRRSK